MTRSAKTMVILASVVFLTLSLAGHSAGKEAPTPKPAVPTPKLPKLVAPTPKLPKLVAPTPKLPKLVAPTLKLPKLVAPTLKLPKLAAPTLRPPKRRVKPAEDPYKDSVILLEAFMVQVRLSALYSLGVPAISQGCKSVSADHILKLLKDTDTAVVTAGAKLAIGQKNKANTDSTARQGIYVGPPEKRKVEYVEVGTSFMAIAEIRREKKIFVELEFEHSAIEKSDDEGDIGTLVERKWSSSVYLEAGKPTLVGATQDGETATFLLITANIKE